MVVLADLLVETGLAVGFVGFDDRVAGYADLIDHHPIVGCSVNSPDPPLPSFGSLFVMNDWGVETQPLVRLARLNRVPTIARVEGVQDFLDLDTGRAKWPYLRLPYLAADHVLAQGRNDVASLRRSNVQIVGNGRMETFFKAAERSSARSGRAIINSNFTYGVLTEARASFLIAAIDSCRDVGLSPIISQHPADRELPERFDEFATTETMSDLLHRSDVLVSRFSTVPFEAMAIGTPFVYFNPHGERVSTFSDPKGGYESALDQESLNTALTVAVEGLGTFRARSEPFFRDQIDITEEPAPARTVRAILDVLAG